MFQEPRLRCEITIPEYGLEELPQPDYSMDLARTVSEYEVPPGGKQFCCEKELKSTTEDWLTGSFRCLVKALSMCVIDREVYTNDDGDYTLLLCRQMYRAQIYLVQS